MKTSTNIIFRSARQYHAACERLRVAPTNDEAMQVAYPCIYMAILASELYLKCLVFRLHGNVPHHHKLERLFGALDANIRSAIVEKWDSHIVTLDQQIAHISEHLGSTIDTSFVGALRGASRANEELRYIWEARAESYTLLQSLPRILQDVILHDLGGDWLLNGPHG